MEHRSLPVPDGLDGARVDQALAKLLGFSRTQAADIASAGGVASATKPTAAAAMSIFLSMLFLRSSIR